MSLAISLLAMAAMQPATPDWRELSATAERHYAWDANGVTRSGETTTIRLRREPGFASLGPDAYAITKVEIRCATGLARAVETVSYAADGTAGGSDTSPTTFEPIPQNSILNDVRVQVCAPATTSH